LNSDQLDMDCSAPILLVKICLLGSWDTQPGQLKVDACHMDTLFYLAPLDSTILQGK